MPDLSHLIQYRCVSREHLTKKTKERVFLHRSGWAYCPAGRDEAGHEFLPTGGLERRHLETQQGKTQQGTRR